MSTALGLAMQISANTAQLATAVADVTQKLDAIGAAGKKASSDLGTLKNIEIAKLALGGIQAATTAFLGLGRAVLGTVESLTRFGLSVANELDELNDVAQRTGVNVEALQSYGAAAKLTGSSLDTFARSLQKLTIEIGQASLDEKAQKSFTNLGIAFDELREKAPTQQFETVADAIARIADPAERAAAAVSVFGKGGVELGPLFAEGPGALARMREEAERLGLVVSSDAIQSIGQMNDAFDKVFMTIKGITGQIVGELAGPIAGIAEELLGIVQAAGPQRIAQQVAGGLLDFIKLAGNAFFGLASFIEAFVKKFAPILGLDIRSEAEKELGRLRGEASLDALTGRNANVDGFGRPIQNDNAEAARRSERIAQLEAQVAAQSSQSLLARSQEAFNRAIDTAATSLERRLEDQARTQQAVIAQAPQPAAVETARTDVQVSVEPATDTEVGAGLSALESATEEQTGELRLLRRELLSIGGQPVDILGN